jgi:hypothetical protein
MAALDSFETVCDLDKQIGRVEVKRLCEAAKSILADE